MPAKTEKQEHFMQAVAHNPKFAKEVGVKQKVGREFTKKRFAKGGSTEYIDSQVEAAVNPKPKSEPPTKVLPPGSLAKEGLTAAEKAKRAKGPPEEMLRRHESRFAKGGSIDGCAKRGKTRGKVV